MTHTCPKRRASDLAYQRTVEREKSTMEIAYRRLEELLSEKGDRLIALGLVDAEDVAALMPHMGVLEDTRIGINFAEALPGGFAKLSRSEEHTSELQSLMRSSYAVFCLKKNK